MTSLLTSLLVFLLTATLAAAANITDYAPTTSVRCPTKCSLLRIFSPPNQTLHAEEIAYVASRGTNESWVAFLGTGADIGYDVRMFESRWSKVGISISGGGYRAALNGAGVLGTLDGREVGVSSAGLGSSGTAGLLQVASYVSGLSGGSWIVGSMIMNDWPRVNDMVLGNGSDLAGWLLDLGLIAPGGLNISSDDNQLYYDSLLWSVLAKDTQGINTSITDIWSRMISYHFLNETTRGNFYTNDSAHGAGQLWSRIPDGVPAYQNRTVPFPLVVADSRPVGSNSTTTPLSPDPVVYEITPLEFGSYDPNLSAMINLTYVGTSLRNASLSSANSCMTGFDEVGFVMGTSSSLFNAISEIARNITNGFSESDTQGILDIGQRLPRAVGTTPKDAAIWPNPFNGLNPGVFLDSNATWLELIDGGSNLENIPLGPLLVRARELEVILAVDSSADTPDSWPNGTSLLYTSNRIKNLLNTSHQDFPPIPETLDALAATGVTSRPTFFGCDPKESPPEYPLIVYLPNTPPVNGGDPVTDTSTFKLQYTDKQTAAFLQQAHLNAASGYVPNELGADPEWGKCLQCATVDRVRLKLQPVLERSDVCKRCFERYCYDPANPPSKADVVGRKWTYVDPDPLVERVAVVSVGRRYRGVIIGSVVGGVVFILLVVGCLVCCVSCV